MISVQTRCAGSVGSNSIERVIARERSVRDTPEPHSAQMKLCVIDETRIELKGAYTATAHFKTSQSTSDLPLQFI